jgi:RNA polymerase sigma-70 factor (ECF subfamily)
VEAAKPFSETDAARGRLVAALAAVARHDRAALRIVYDLTSAKLFGVCLRMSQDHEAAEDILQGVYLKIWDRAGRFDSARASPITWLCAIARNAAIDWRRASGRTVALPIEAAAEIADSRPLADRMLEDAGESARLLGCIDILEHRQQGAIRAAFFDGLAYSELAAAMAVPLGTMKSWIRRGLQQLKRCLDDG